MSPVSDYLADEHTMFPTLNSAATYESFLKLYLVLNSRPHFNVAVFPTLHRLIDVALGKLYPSMFLAQDFLADRPSMSLILNNAAILKSSQKLYLAFHPRCPFNVVALPTMLRPTSAVLAKLYRTNFPVTDYLVDRLPTFLILNNAAILESSLELCLVRNSRPHSNVVALLTI